MTTFNIKVEFDEQAKGVTGHAKIEAIDVSEDDFGRVKEMVAVESKGLFEWAYTQSKRWSLGK